MILQREYQMNNDTVTSLGKLADGSAQVHELEAEGWILSGRYRLLEEIGHGGMGKVHRVVDLEDSGRTCAVKVMHNHLKSDSKNRLRFEREARLAVGLNHPNILNVTDYGITEANEPFIIMELLSGDSLDALLKKQKRLMPDQFKNVFQQVCAGLQYAHESGVVHRDMKPSNIMLIPTPAAQSHVKIVDFGIAKVCRTTGELCPSTGKPLELSITQPGEIFGSPLYMSPEQCFGEEVDCRSEVYSLGCMMFESLCGDAPLRGKNARDTLLQRVHSNAPRLKEVCPDGAFSEDLEDLVARCLKREPADRFQSVAELGLALSRL